jgi:cobalt-zinc-cadmium efflux system membrane fusion protein
MRRLVGLGLILVTSLAYADSGVVAARAMTVTTRLTTYARVEPIAVLHLRAAQAGVVTGLAVLPGETVKAGAIVGHLSGPEIDALLAQRDAVVESARAALTVAQKTLRIEHQKRAQRLNTQQAVAQANAAVIKARAELHIAQSQKQALQATITLQTPAAGRVLNVDAANGERVAQGQTLLTLEPAHHLWLEAVYYGADATSVHTDMHGTFSPADGGSPVAVKVRTVIGVVQPGGGRAVGLISISSHAGWYTGEAGTLALTGAQQILAAVPTRSLIVDRGQWWVLVHSAHGLRRQAVTPGPSRGAWTLIEQGLLAGTEVVVVNAYLQFHRDFSQQYQPPD